MPVEMKAASGIKTLPSYFNTSAEHTVVPEAFMDTATEVEPASLGSIWPLAAMGKGKVDMIVGNHLIHNVNVIFAEVPVERGVLFGMDFMNRMRIHPYLKFMEQAGANYYGPQEVETLKEIKADHFPDHGMQVAANRPAEHANKR